MNRFPARYRRGSSKNIEDNRTAWGLPVFTGLPSSSMVGVRVMGTFVDIKTIPTHELRTAWIIARTINRLTDFKMRQRRKPGLYPNGAGLYLQVTASGAKS
jgi:hypothetical protein